MFFPILTITHIRFSVAECAQGQVAGIFDKGWLGSSLQVFGQTGSQEALPAQKHSRKHSRGLPQNKPGDHQNAERSITKLWFNFDCFLFRRL